MPQATLKPEEERICRLIRAGNTYQVAAEATGIDEDALQARLENDAQFRQAVNQAEAESESIMVTQIAKAANNGSWRAAAWLLEHRSPKTWGDGERRKDPPPPPVRRSRLDELGARREARRSGDSAT